ncbi:MAG TPA: DUF4180 domain-containing protein [Herpetosiphonaceae bacterium]
MKLTLCDVQGQRFMEGVPGQPLIERAEDVGSVLETCFAHAVDRLLLYPENLTARFFDLSSGEAGMLLQKLRTYHIRLAIVSSPTLRMSRRFADLLADEQRGPDVRLFDERAAAQEWLCSGRE